MGRIKKIQKAIDFIEYISKPMKKEELFLLYKINGIVNERAELYLDFLSGLFDLITTTYLGDDIYDTEDINKHFNWCWNKNIENFKKEKIYFLNNNELYDYFFVFYQESFYKEKDKTQPNINKLLNFWENIFKINEYKSMSEFESFLDLYKIFNKSLQVN